MSRPRVKVPSSASVGEIVEIKTLITHKMESGQRKDRDGNVIPRQIINKFVAKFNGTDVFTAELQPAVSANPYISFFFKAEQAGEMSFEWHDDNGEVYSTTKEIAVS